MQKYGTQADFVSAGGYHHHIGLNTWYSKDLPPPDIHNVGLFHTAILYPTRKGASDHGVSEALYLNDPDQNGVELIGTNQKTNGPATLMACSKCLLDRLTLMNF